MQLSLKSPNMPFVEMERPYKCQRCVLWLTGSQSTHLLAATPECLVLPLAAEHIAATACCHNTTHTYAVTYLQQDMCGRPAASSNSTNETPSVAQPNQHPNEPTAEPPFPLTHTGTLVLHQQ